MPRAARTRRSSPRRTRPTDRAGSTATMPSCSARARRSSTSIGQVGVDPGTEWGTGLTSTADNTLRRKAAIGAGDTNGTDAFDPSIEWDGFATDTFGGLGSHAYVPPDPVINEFSASTTGTDVEYVEIYGAAATSYAAYTILEIEGDTGAAVGTIDEVIALGTTGADRLYLVNLAGERPGERHHHPPPGQGLQRRAQCRPRHEQRRRVRHDAVVGDRRRRRRRTTAAPATSTYGVPGPRCRATTG